MQRYVTQGYDRLPWRWSAVPNVGDPFLRWSPWRRSGRTKGAGWMRLGVDLATDSIEQQHPLLSRYSRWLP